MIYRWLIIPNNIEYPLQFRYDSARSDVIPRMKTNFATIPRELREHGTQRTPYCGFAAVLDRYRKK